MKMIELQSSDTFELFCPFCGERAIGGDELSTCKHTLFHASQHGFEFVSDTPQMNALSKQFNETIDDVDIEQLIAETDYPNAVCFIINQPAPSGFAGYVAFSDQ